MRRKELGEVFQSFGNFFGRRRNIVRAVRSRLATTPVLNDSYGARASGVGCAGHDDFMNALEEGNGDGLAMQTGDGVFEGRLEIGVAKGLGRKMEGGWHEARGKRLAVNLRGEFREKRIATSKSVSSGSRIRLRDWRCEPRQCFSWSRCYCEAD